MKSDQDLRDFIHKVKSNPGTVVDLITVAYLAESLLAQRQKTRQLERDVQQLSQGVLR